MKIEHVQGSRLKLRLGFDAKGEILIKKQRVEKTSNHNTSPWIECEDRYYRPNLCM
jgi:hypothetical protein